MYQKYQTTRKPVTPYAVKFTRDPRFTPACLTTHQLGRIEALALCIVKRTNGPTVTLGKEDADDLVSSWKISFRKFHLPANADFWTLPVQGELTQAIRTEISGDAENYLVNCIKWVIACGNNGGWIRKSAPVTDNRAYWAQVRGSY